MTARTLTPNRTVAAQKGALAGRQAARTVTTALVAGVLGCALTLGHPQHQPSFAQNSRMSAFGVVSTRWYLELGTSARQAEDRRGISKPESIDGGAGAEGTNRG